MNTSLFAKIFGWAQFVIQAGNQVASAGTPHGWAGWLTTIASLAAAIGIHGAANTGGSQGVSTNK